MWIRYNIKTKKPAQQQVFHLYKVKILMPRLSICILLHVAKILSTISPKNQDHQITKHGNNKGILNAKLICQITLENRNYCAS